MLFTCVAAVGLFTFVVVLPNVIRDLVGPLLAGQLTTETAVRLILLIFPFAVSFALPAGILTGVLLTLGRLSADSEVTAMRAAGIGLGRAARPVFILATLGMIGGQYLDITGTQPDMATLHTLKTGCLFAAAVGMALWAAGVPVAQQGPWRAFGAELGLLFQVVDDILDGDGYVETHGVDGARRIADESADRAQAALAQVAADTSVLAGIVENLRSRTV